MLESVTSADRLLCVDFFERPGGGYGFEHLRADPEDQGRWTPVGNLAGTSYTSLAGAADAAQAAVGWLTSEAAAVRQIETWLADVRSS